MFEIKTTKLLIKTVIIRKNETRNLKYKSFIKSLFEV